MTTKKTTSSFAASSFADRLKEVSPFPVFDPAEFTKITTRNLDIASRSARSFMEGAAELNREMLGFVNARVKNDFESAQAIASSKTSQEAFRAQAAFVETALRDYADGASKVFHLAADLAKDTLSPMEEGAEELLQTLDARAEPAAKKSQTRAAAE